MKYAFENIKNIVQKYNHIVLWGQGRKLVALYDTYANELKYRFYYVDNSPSKKGKDFFGLPIHSPEELVDYDADLIILAVGEKNLFNIKNKVREILKRQNRNVTKVITLGELMNPSFRDLPI